MTLAIPCDFCDPWSVMSSPGVSSDSQQLEKEDKAARERELFRAEDTKVKRQEESSSILNRLYSKAREEDWDGEGAPAITLGAIGDAKKLIGQIPEHYPMPEMHAEQTGEIGLEWYIDPYRVLLLTIPGDGFVYYNALFGYKNADYGSKPIVGKLHQKILSLLADLYRS